MDRAELGIRIPSRARVGLNAGERMHFDDRLATVLRHRAAGEAAARTQFRQLLDLLGARNEGRDESLRAAAWLRLGALGEMIPARERARMISEKGWRFQNPSLAAHLAEDEPDVAAAALARADLTGHEWDTLIPTLPIRARGFLRLRKGLPENAVELLDRLGVSDRGLPAPVLDEVSAEVESKPEEAQPLELTADAEIGEAPETVAAQGDDAEPEPRIPASMATGQISELVARIEAFQRARSAPATADETRKPLGRNREEPSRAPILGFAFSTDASGRIEWAEPRVAPMVVGVELPAQKAAGSEMPGKAMTAAFLSRQPVRNAPITLDGAPGIAGDWILDAVPRFTRPSGRFYGYAGKLRRPAKIERHVAGTKQQQEADRIRQLLHELRTPVNAIQGFAEVIQQQLFGATPHEYRALAATIASDAARMLAGFDELDRLARLEAGSIALSEGDSDVGTIVRRQLDQLQAVLRARLAGFEARLTDRPCNANIAAGECEQLSWRLLATLAGLARGGEKLGLELACDGEELALACELPAALVSTRDIFSTEFHATGNSVSAGIFGAGFALRLARAEARSAGGNLVRVKDHLVLTLPLQEKPGSAEDPDDLPEDNRRRAANG